LGGSGGISQLGQLLADPFMSPANLSDVSDLGEGAADVPLEPGEILDTPGVTNDLFNFKSSTGSSSSSSKGGTGLIGNILGGPPDHQLPGGRGMKKEVKKEQQPQPHQHQHKQRSHHAKTEGKQDSRQQLKQEPILKVENPSHTFGLALGGGQLPQHSKKTPSPTKRSNPSGPTPKKRSLFSPEQTDPAPAVPQLVSLPTLPTFPPKLPSDSSSRTRTTSSSSAASETSPSVKLSKLDQMPGYEKLKDGRTSIRVPKEERQNIVATLGTPSVKVSIPIAPKTASLFDDKRVEKSSPGSASSEQHKEKKKKKKEKKEKKEKKDKDRKRDRDEGGGSSSGTEKRHKNKHKDKDRERSPAVHKQPTPSGATASPHGMSSSGFKIKIKPVMQAAAAAGAAPVAPIKISIGDSAKKRSRPPSSGDSGPASKMSRVIGTPVEVENGYLHGMMGQSGKNRHH
jgi:hypothetical protein